MTPLYPPHRRPARGRSLIELMVAILIGSLVLAGVLIITSSTSSIGRRADSLSGLTDTGQTALQLLAADVRMAGYSIPRTYFAAGYTTKMLATAGIRGCDAGFTNNAAATLNILTCNGGASASGASLSLSYEADEWNSILVNGDTGPVPTDCRGIGLVPITGQQGNTARPLVAQDSMSESPAYWRVENRYYIANSGPDNEPTLMCTGNGGDAPFTQPQPLVRGVERMVITYGVSRGAIDASRSESVLVIDNPGVASYMTANEIDTNAAWAGEPTDVRWQRVVSVRVCLVTRGGPGSAEKIDTENPSYFNCEGVRTSITDGLARRTVRMTMNLRNRTMSVDSTAGIGLGGV